MVYSNIFHLSYPSSYSLLTLFSHILPQANIPDLLFLVSILYQMCSSLQSLPCDPLQCLNFYG